RDGEHHAHCAREPKVERQDRVGGSAREQRPGAFTAKAGPREGACRAKRAQAKTREQKRRAWHAERCQEVSEQLRGARGKRRKPALPARAIFAQRLSRVRERTREERGGSIVERVGRRHLRIQ